MAVAVVVDRDTPRTVKNISTYDIVDGVLNLYTDSRKMVASFNCWDFVVLKRDDASDES